MKNKKLMIFLIIFTSIMVLVVLSSAIFSLKHVDVEFMNQTTVLTDTQNSIVASAEFKYGESVFLANKNLYIKNMEKANPYLRVVNIETKFPNRFVIHAVERTECYVIKMSNNKYVITDENLKVLKITNVFQNTASNAIEVKNSVLANQTVNEGDFFQTDDYLKNVFTAFREWKLSYSDVKANIISIELDYEKPNNLLVNMRSGVQIIIENSVSQISDKLNLAFSIYDTKTKNGQPVDYTQSGTIYVFETTEKIYALYRPAE